MEGEYMAAAGGNCAAYTQKNAQQIYFFDTDSGEWTGLDLGTPQTFHSLIAEGSVIMAFTDSLLVGYSGSTSEWDTLYYSGELLQSNHYYPSMFSGYGTGESLGYFVTDTHYYVFDAELGKWMSHPYILPAAYQGYNATFWSCGDYAAAFVPDYESGYNYIHLNMAYSLHTHSFSAYERGGAPTLGYMLPPPEKTGHGYISGRNEDGKYLVLGYCALGNTYHPMWIDPRPRSLGYGSTLQHSNYDKITVASYYYNEYISPEEEIVHMYGFDTQRGAWSLDTFTFNPQYEQAGQSNGWYYGGQVAVAARVIIDRSSPKYMEYTFIVYNGQTGDFRHYSPGLTYSDAGDPYPKPGGTVAMAHDGNEVWFHSIETGQSLVEPLRWSETVEDFYSENFIVLITSESDQDSADVFIYNGTMGSVIKKTIRMGPKTDDIYGNSRMCVIYAGTHSEEVLLYSGITHVLSEFTFPPADLGPGVWFDQGLAFIRSYTDNSIFYDSRNNALFYTDYPMKPMGLGHRAAVMKKDDNTIDTYSSITGNWMEHTVPDKFYLGATEDAVGLLRSPSNSFFYAFNGYNDNLIKLQPHGRHRLYAIGGSTILVCQSDSLYAFDPFSGTSVDSDPIALIPGEFQLMQNYPNPFNPATTIPVSVPEPGRIRLDVYDITGRKVATLTDRHYDAGIHPIRLDASLLASGVYLVRAEMHTVDGRTIRHTLTISLVR